MRTRTRRTVAALSGLTLLLAACADDGDDVAADDAADVEAPDGDDYDFDAQPDDAQASFVSPADGDTVDTLTVELAAEGVDIVPADAPAVGEAHLHVMVDIGCVDSGEIIPGPDDETRAEGYVHFGDGSNGGEIELEPGTYELCVQLADGVHRAYGQTETITVTVE